MREHVRHLGDIMPIGEVAGTPAFVPLNTSLLASVRLRGGGCSPSKQASHDVAQITVHMEEAHAAEEKAEAAEEVVDELPHGDVTSDTQPSLVVEAPAASKDLCFESPTTRAVSLAHLNEVWATCVIGVRI